MLLVGVRLGLVGFGIGVKGWLRLVAYGKVTLGISRLSGGKGNSESQTSNLRSAAVGHQSW